MYVGGGFVLLFPMRFRVWFRCRVRLRSAFFAVQVELCLCPLVGGERLGV